MPQQSRHQARLTTPAGLGHEGQLGVGAQLRQAELAHLGEGAGGASALGPPEEAGVVRRIRQVPHGAVEAGGAQSLGEGARRVRVGQGPDHLGEQVTPRSDAQPLACPAPGAARGGVLALAGSAGVLEGLTQRQVGEETPSQHHPEEGLRGQHTVAAGTAPARVQRLPDVPGVINGCRPTRRSGRFSTQRPLSDRVTAFLMLRS